MSSVPKPSIAPEPAGRISNLFARATTSILTLLPPVVVALVMLAPGLTGGPTLDASVFTHIGLAIRAGDLPYRDAWDHKPPGIYLLLAFAQSALPMLGAWVVTWLSTAAFTVGTLVVIGRLLERNRPGGGHGIAMLGGAVALTCYPLALGGGHTEEFAVLPGTAAFLLAAWRPNPRGGFGAGVLVGVANLLSLQAIPIAIAVALMLLLGSAARARITTIAIFAAGGGAVGLAALVWVLASGLLPSALDALVTYNATYSALNWANPGRLGTGLQNATLILWFLILPAVWRLVRRQRYGPLTRIDRGCIAWLGATVPYFLYQSRIEGHYAITAVPALVMLAAPVISATLTAMTASFRGLARGLVPVIVVLTTSGTVAVVQGNREYVALVAAEQVTGAAAWIRNHSSPSDRIFIWGNQPDLYDAAQRFPASRWIYLFPLMTPGYSTSAQAADLAATLEARRPELIIDAGSKQPGAPTLLPALLIARPLLPGDGRTFDALDPVRTLVRDHYVLADIVNGWPMYVRR